MTNTLHAHVETYSTDCDGSYTRTYDVFMTPSEAAKDFADIDLTNRVVSRIVNAYSIFQQGTLTVTRLSDGDVRLEWSEATEEGGIHTSATLCSEDCQPEKSTQRDHRAEDMGY